MSEKVNTVLIASGSGTDAKSIMKAHAAGSIPNINLTALISTKPGQSYFKHALKLKEKYPDKKFFFIVHETLDFASLEDFPFVQVWVNTACPPSVLGAVES